MPPDETPVFNPYAADSVIIGASLSNYPCVARIIDSLSEYTNMNAAAQVALSTIFGVKQRINLTFVADSGLPLDEDAHTEPGNLNSTESVYRTTIHLNTWVLTHSTQQYIAATIIHESIHAYIQYCYHQYLNNLMDSTQFKTMFPLYWPPRSISQTNYPYYYQMGNSAQHRAMAANLISIMAAPLKSMFPNPGLNVAVRDSIYDAITWGGLAETPLFAARNDSLYIRAMNSMAKDTSIHAPFIISGYPNTQYNRDAHNSNLVKGCQ